MSESTIPVENRKFVFKRGLHAWTLVLFLVILIPSVYGFLYYKSRDTYLTSHYFRSLSEIERQINQSLVGLDKLMDSSWVKGAGFCRLYESHLEQRFCENYADYLIKYSDRYKNIQFFKSAKACLMNDSQNKEEIGSDKTCFQITGVINNLKVEVFQKRESDAVKVPLKDLIDPAPALKYFDQILLLDKQGDLIYRSGSDDLTTSDNYSARDDYSRFENLQFYLQRDTFWQLDSDKTGFTNKETKKPPSHSTIREATIGSVSYRLFIQPFHAVRPQYTRKINSALEQNSRWQVRSEPGELAYILGVIPEQKYVFEVISLPMGKITIAIFVALTLLLLTPHIKLVLSGIHFMPGRMFTFLLALSFPLMMLLAILALLSVNEYYKLRSSFDVTADRIAEQIKENFSREFDHLFSVSGVVTSCLEEVEFPSYNSFIGGNYRLLKPGSNCYPPFEMLYYLNKKGRQSSVQYTYRNFPSYRIVANKRNYFTQPRYNPENLHNWVRRDDNALMSYFSERIQTYDHGIKLTAVSFPCDDENCRPEDARVKVLIKRLQTFFQPVMPLGFGFAVVNDANGKVIYHSNNQRSLLENFYIESDQNSELIAIIQARRPKTINANYNGTAHRFLSRPLRHTPWSLVIFYDKELMELVSFKVSSYSIFISFICVLGFSLFIMILCCSAKFKSVLLTFLPAGAVWRPLADRWPGQQHTLSFFYLSMVLSVLFISCGFIACSVFSQVNSEKITQLSKLNLLHVGQELAIRHKHLLREINRAIIKEHNASIQPAKFSYLQENDKQLLHFANYAQTTGNAMQPKFWQTKISFINSDSPCLPSTEPDREDWELFFPIFNPVDAKYRQAFFNNAGDQSWCLQQQRTDNLLSAEFKKPGTFAGLTIQGLARPDQHINVRKLMDKLYLLSMIVVMPVIYTLLKQTAIRLFGLGFPSIQQWRHILNEYENKIYAKNATRLQMRDTEDQWQNLNIIASANSGHLLELKSILFNRSRLCLANTTNILPLMCLLHSGIFTRKNGIVDFDNPKVKKWISEQPWEQEIENYQEHEQRNLWQLVAPMFYTSLLFVFAILMLSGGNMINMVLSISPFLIAGGMPFLMQIFGKIYRH